MPNKELASSAEAKKESNGYTYILNKAEER